MAAPAQTHPFSSISVKVTDPSNSPVASAVVTLTAKDGTLRQTQTTTTDGACRFQSLTVGDYFLQAGAEGFTSSTLETASLEGKPLELVLSLRLADVRDSVSVTAGLTPQSPDEIAKALTVVDSQTIALRDEATLSDALREVPGMRIQRLGGPGSATYFKMRGLRNEDTAVLVDGFRIRDAAGTQADASGVLQDLIVTNADRVEVLRGSGSSLYGSNATGGVVNMVTDEGGGKTRGSVLMEGGSLSMMRGVAKMSGGLAHDRLQYSAGVAHLNVMSGLEGTAPARNTSMQSQLMYRLTRTATLSARLYTANTFAMVRSSPQGIGMLPATGSVEAMPISLDQQRRYEGGTPLSQLAAGSANFVPSAANADYARGGRMLAGAVRFNAKPLSTVTVTAQYQGLATTRNYVDGPAGPGSQPKGSSLSSYDGVVHTANARASWTPTRWQTLEGGYEFESERYASTSFPPSPSPSFLVNTTQRSNAVFAQEQLHLFDSRLQIGAAYRAQWFNLDTPSFTPSTVTPFDGKTFAAPPTAQTWDGSAAYLFRSTGTKIRTHAGRGYRAPSLYERFGTSFSGTRYTLYGDPALRPERVTAVDAGIDQRFWNSRAMLSATYFFTRLNQVILFDTTGIINPGTDPLGRTGGYRNTAGGLARGTEFSASVAATRKLQLAGSYTFTDARQRTPLVAGVWQTYAIPDHQFNISATQRFSERLAVFAIYTGSSNFLAPVYSASSGGNRAYRFEGMRNLGLGATYRRPINDALALRFHVKLDNALNQAYFENGYRTPGILANSGIQLEF